MIVVRCSWFVDQRAGDTGQYRPRKRAGHTITDHGTRNGDLNCASRPIRILTSPIRNLVTHPLTRTVLTCVVPRTTNNDQRTTNYELRTTNHDYERNNVHRSPALHRVPFVCRGLSGM